MLILPINICLLLFLKMDRLIKLIFYYWIITLINNYCKKILKLFQTGSNHILKTDSDQNTRIRNPGSSLTNQNKVQSIKTFLPSPNPVYISLPCRELDWVQEAIAKDNAEGRQHHVHPGQRRGKVAILN